MSSLLEQAESIVAAMEEHVARPGSAGFERRAAALDELDVDVLDRLRLVEQQDGSSAKLLEVRERAAVLRARLDAANERLFHRLRARIASGRYTPEGLRRAFARLAGPPGRAAFDTLDLLVAGLLDAGEAPDPRRALEREMVAYQPTPARATLELIERAELRREDVFYDLGAGLGHVVILVALLTGAKARGIEIEPAYGEHARRCADALRNPGVDIIEADAREASFAGGTVFFLFTPFRGALLDEVLGRLRVEASTRPIRVCTYGPCTMEVARAPWLSADDAHALSEDAIAVFRSVVANAPR